MGMDQATLDLAARELPVLMTPGYRPPPSYVTGLSWLPGLPPFTMAIVDAMRRDYQVKLAMAMKVVPVMKPLFAITGDPEVVDFVKSELRSIWTSSITDMTEAMWYTRFGCEMVYKKADGDFWRFARMMPYHPRDFKILTKDGEISGLRVVSSASTSDVDTENFAGQPRGMTNKPVIFAPKSFVYVHDKKFGSFEGMSELEGAYPSWMEKVREGGAVASRSLWSYKCMFDSGMILHPEGSFTNPTTGEQIPYRDFALKIGESVRNGSVIAAPAIYDGNGNLLWNWIRPEMNTGGEALMTLIDHLDGKINKGAGIPDDVIEQVSGTGSYAGRTIPFIAFLEAGTPTVRNISRELCRQSLVPLAQINFGESRGKDWEITEAGVNTTQFLGDAKAGKVPGDGDGDGVPNEGQQQQQMSLADIHQIADKEGLTGMDRKRFVQGAIGAVFSSSSVTFVDSQPRRVLRAKTIQMSATEQPRDEFGRWTDGHSAHGRKLPRNRDKMSHHEAIPIVNAMGFHVNSHKLDQATGHRVFEIQNKHGEKKRISHEQLIDLAYSKPSGEPQSTPKLKSAHIVAAMQKVDPGADRGALIGTRDLRKQFGDLSKEEFDAKIMRMAEKGKLTLHHHDFAFSLSQAERDELVSYPVPEDSWWGHKGRAYVVGVAVRSNPTQQMSNHWQSEPRDAHGQWMAGSSTHSVKLPKKAAKLSIQKAHEALTQMGFELAISHHDLQNKKTIYDVKNREGQIRKLDTDQIKELIYSGIAAEPQSQTPTDAAYDRGNAASKAIAGKADQAMVNVPLSKRGNIDAQIDKHKQTEASKSRATGNELRKQEKADRIEAKRLAELHGKQLAAKTAEKSGKSIEEVVDYINHLISVNPEAILKLLRKYESDNTQQMSQVIDDLAAENILPVESEEV